MSDRALRIILPVAVLLVAVLSWKLVVWIFEIPPYLLPGPDLVTQTLIADSSLLWNSLLVTLLTTFEGFLLAAVGGIGLALLSRRGDLYLQFAAYLIGDACSRRARDYLDAQFDTTWDDPKWFNVRRHDMYCRPDLASSSMDTGE